MRKIKKRLGPRNIEINFGSEKVCLNKARWVGFLLFLMILLATVLSSSARESGDKTFIYLSFFWMLLGLATFVYFIAIIDDSDKWIVYKENYNRSLKFFIREENKRFFRPKGAHVIIGPDNDYLRIILNFGPYKNIRLKEKIKEQIRKSRSFVVDWSDSTRTDRMSNFKREMVSFLDELQKNIW